MDGERRGCCQSLRRINLIRIRLVHPTGHEACQDVQIRFPAASYIKLS